MQCPAMDLGTRFSPVPTLIWLGLSEWLMRTERKNPVQDFFFLPPRKSLKGDIVWWETLEVSLDLLCMAEISNFIIPSQGDRLCKNYINFRIWLQKYPCLHLNCLHCIWNMGILCPNKQIILNLKASLYQLLQKKEREKGCNLKDELGYF